ncbi:MAG TPA: MgtC/SapB family protein [Candidatus Polarisedimenticolia bacterium]|jgi:putative Mg2+ transporter-C (MgtC) family protein|nr:MgtC/SapB family protein [Candidatus Polarisedimenticolia bacterium]
MNTLAILLPHVTLADLFSKTMVRLMLAAFLGGIIGLERELKRKPAGLRTNMFICFGSAMFTILSNELAGEWGIGDHTRIAAQIIPGIGFIGAGSILHDKGGVSGITTAATLFVVASIGMAAGGGLYLEAIFATMLIYLALHLLGILERQLNLKPLRMNYMIVSEKTADDLVAEVNSILEDQGKEMQAMRLSRSGENEKLVFRVDGTRNEHKQLMNRLRESPGLSNLETTAGMEID